MSKIQVCLFALALACILPALSACTTNPTQVQPDPDLPEPSIDAPPADETPQIAGAVLKLAEGGYIPADLMSSSFLFRLVEDVEYSYISDTISSLENAEQARAAYITGLEDFRHVDLADRDIPKAEVVAEFSVPIYTYLKTEPAQDFHFYQVRYGEQSLLIPAEAGQVAGNLRYGADGATYLVTARDIWHITPDGQAEPLTNPTYEGQTLEDLWQAKQNSGDTASESIFWVDAVTLSPDGRYLAYLSNRDTWPANAYSVWLYDTQAGEERLLLPGDGVYRRPLGWLDAQTLMVENNQPGEYSTYCFVDPDGKQTDTALSERQPWVLDLRGGLLAHVFDDEAEEQSILIGRYLPEEKRLEALGQIELGETIVSEGKFSPAGNYFGYLGDGWQETLYLYQISSGNLYAINHEHLTEFTENTQLRDFYWLDERNLLIISEDNPDGGAYHRTTWWYALEN